MDAVQQPLLLPGVLIGEGSRPAVQAVDARIDRTYPYIAVRILGQGVDRIVGQPARTGLVAGEPAGRLGEGAKALVVGAEPDRPVAALVDHRNVVLRDGVLVVGIVAVERQPARGGRITEEPLLDGRDPDLSLAVLHHLDRPACDGYAVGRADVEVMEVVDIGIVDIHAVVQRQPDAAAVVDLQIEDRIAREAAAGAGAVIAETGAVEAAQTVVRSEPDEARIVLNDSVDLVGCHPLLNRIGSRIGVGAVRVGKHRVQSEESQEDNE